MKNRKVVINKCYGGFGLSYEAVMLYAKLKGIELYPFIDDTHKKIYGKKATIDNPEIMLHYTTKPIENEDELYDDEIYFSDRDIPRDDPCLVKAVEQLGENASGRFASLKVVKVPADVEWAIEEYDGIEWVAEAHKTWG